MTPQHPAPDPDRYLTIDGGPEVETRVRGSRFIAQLLHAGSEAEADAHLAAIRKRFHDATHHCWAMRVGSPGQSRERSGDDGEPAGTAGAPILTTLVRAELFDTIAVVTRYFGGTKLGTGGLHRAYGDAAAAALAAAPPRALWRQERLEIVFRYEDLGSIEATLLQARDAILAVSREFEPRPRIVVAVRRSRAETLKANLVDATAGRAGVRSLQQEAGRS